MPIASAAADRLRFELLGALVLPSDPDWDEARAAWNLAVDQRPAAVLLAADAEDVATGVRFAAANGLRVLGQSTGHLAAPLGDLADTILIRTIRMQEISVDEDALVVRVEAGVTWGAVNAALEGTGLVGLAGSSPDVGVVGYTLGGGYGWLARSRGLAASSVTAVSLVLADGTQVRATAETHPDLFWAVRGGGGAFGIVTGIEFRVYPIADVYAGMLLFPIDHAGEVLRAYARWTLELDERVTTSARLLRFPPVPELPAMVRGGSFVGVDGAIDADDDEAAALLAPLRDLGPEVDTFGRIPSTDLSLIHLDPPAPVPVLADGMIVEELTPEAIAALLASSAGDPRSPLLLVDLRHLGGAVGRPAPGGGAVDRLPGRYLVYAGGISVPESAEALAAAVESVRVALGPWAPSRDYGNFREARVAAERLWDAEALVRLRRVKAAVDPSGLIRSAHPLT